MSGTQVDEVTGLNGYHWDCCVFVGGLVVVVLVCWCLGSVAG